MKLTWFSRLENRLKNISRYYWWILILLLIFITTILYKNLYAPSSISSLIQQFENERYQKLQFQKQAWTRSKTMLAWPSVQYVYEVYVPQLECWTAVRVGPIGDGGYVLCNPWMLAKWKSDCVLYSFGIQGVTKFEMDFYEITNRACSIFCFDEDNERDSLFKSFNGKFMKSKISNKTDTTSGEYSIFDLTKKFGHTKMDIMKMDIEGAEYTALPEFFHNFKNPVCQIVMQLHADQNQTGNDLNAFFKMMEQNGYRMFYREVNLWSTNNFYYSYIHQACFERFGLRKDAVLFTYFV